VVPNQTLYAIDVATRDEGLVLAGLLNSVVVNALALETAERAKDHHWRYLASVLATVPVPVVRPGDDAWRSLVKLGRRAEAGAADDRALNRLVGDMYGLSPEEVARLERFVDGCTGLTG
jgi:hypothetical protein